MTDRNRARSVLSNLSIPNVAAGFSEPAAFGTFDMVFVVRIGTVCSKLGVIVSLLDVDAGLENRAAGEDDSEDIVKCKSDALV